MNPEEGDLRPQLLDRFGLAVDVTAPRDPGQRAEVVRRRIAFDADSAGFVDRVGVRRTPRSASDIAAPRTPTAVGVLVDEPLLDLITRICVASEVDGLRADIIMYKAAVALAALRRA